MKNLRILTVALFILFLSASGRASLCFAHAPGAQDLEAINKAAELLKSSNSDLSNRLTEYAKTESEEGAEEQDEDDEGDPKVLEDAAAVLEKDHPDLVASLRKFAGEETKEMSKD